MSGYTVSELAREFGVKPRDVSMLFYNRVVPESVGPIHNGRRIVSLENKPAIEQALRERGHLPSEQDAGAVS